MDKETLQYTKRHKGGMLTRSYSSTILLLGSIALFSHSRVYGQNNAVYQTEPLKQSMIAEFALEYEQADIALKNYTYLATHTDSTIAKQRALDVALAQNDLDDALKIVQHWVKQDPKDVPALFYLTHIALKSHRYALTASTLENILSIDSDADLGEILAGISPENEKDRQTLLNALRQSKAQNNPAILVLIASLESQNNEIEQALKDVQKALNKRPYITSFILLKANLLEALGNQKATEEWYASASYNHKSNLEIRLAEVKYLIKISKPELALTRLEKILNNFPKAEEALFIAGLTSIDLQRYDDAENYLVQLKNSSQYQNDASYYLAINAERKQHYETAITYYRLVDGSLYTVSRRNLINIFYKQNRLFDALRFLTQERVNYPQHASFLYQLQADILKKMNNKPAAIELLNEAIHNLPDDPDLIYAQVLLLDPYQQRDLLEQDLNKLLEIDENNPAYLNAYAYTLALQNRRLDDARHYAQQALENAPDQASILDTYGFVTFLQNDYKVAIPALEKAFASNHSLSTGLRLAQALYLNGNSQKFNLLAEQLKTEFKHDPQLEQLAQLTPPTLKKANNDASIH